MTTSRAFLTAGAICLAAAALEGLLAGSGVRRRLDELRQPPHSPTFAVWIAIGIAYYLIVSFVVFRLLRLEPSFRRSGVLVAIGALLIGNALWSLAFFRRKSLAAGAAGLAAYASVAVVVEILVARIDRVSASVFLVYLLYLVYAVWWLRSLRRLNRHVVATGERA